MSAIAITNNTQRRVGGVRVAVKGTLPVRERDGSVRNRAVLVTPDAQVEVFDDDEVDIGATRYRVAIDVVGPTVTLTPVEP